MNEIQLLQAELDDLREQLEINNASHDQAIREADEAEAKYEYLKSLLGEVYYSTKNAPTNPIQVLDGYKQWMQKALAAGRPTKTGFKEWTARERDLLLATVSALEDVVGGRFS